MRDYSLISPSSLWTTPLTYHETGAGTKSSKICPSDILPLQSSISPVVKLRQSPSNESTSKSDTWDLISFQMDGPIPSRGFNEINGHNLIKHWYIWSLHTSEFQNFMLWGFCLYRTTFPLNAELTNSRRGSSEYSYSGAPELWTSEVLTTTYSLIPECQTYECPESHQQLYMRGGDT